MGLSAPFLRRSALWFDAEQSPHDLCLFSYSVGRWDLLVIPPECDPSRTDRLMARVRVTSWPKPVDPDNLRIRT